MIKTNESSFSEISEIQKIDNSRLWLPTWTSLLLVFLIVLMVWFFRGGSFRLYASIFFLIYSVTHQIWISVILIGILQNVLFMPLRLIGNHFNNHLKDFEDELDKMKKADQQYLVFNKKVREGDPSIVFYIFNFFVNAIAFCSAGRIFLIDFYSDPLQLKKMNLLYNFVTYPQYPLKGINLYVPLIKVTQTMAINWSKIFMGIGLVFLFFIVLRLLWQVLRLFVGHNPQILSIRIKYNRFLFTVSGFIGVLLVLTIIFLRHIPTAFQSFIFAADLSHQNTPMNFTTAVGTFITTIYAGFQNNFAAIKKAEGSGIPSEVIEKVFKNKTIQSFQNALILGAGAFFITNNIPSAFELSVTVFEVMYMIYPFTFGLLIRNNSPAPVKLTIEKKS